MSADRRPDPAPDAAPDGRGRDAGASRFRASMLERPSTAEALARVLREQILSGAIPAGTRLREVEVADGALSRTARVGERYALRAVPDGEGHQIVGGTIQCVRDRPQCAGPFGATCDCETRPGLSDTRSRFLARLSG